MQLVILWLVSTLIVGVIGGYRTIRFWPAFFLSLFLSPLIGLIITLFFKEAEPDSFSKWIMKDPQDVAPPPAGQDLDTQLRKLSALKTDGLLTEEEFDIQRRRILGY